jgi:hypothetical protein
LAGKNPRDIAKGAVMKIDKTQRWDCHDCGCKEGELHQYGCDMEECPFCGGQLLSCDCKYHKLGLFDAKLYNANTSYLPPNVYTKGLSDEQEERWLDMLAEAGQIPYIQWPVLCAYCGEQWPDFFSVSDDEWQHYIQPSMQHKVVCKKCYQHIKRVNNKAEKVAQMQDAKEVA